MTREQAINYLFSSGFTNEQVGEVVRALTYEPTPKNDLVTLTFSKGTLKYSCKDYVVYKKDWLKSHYGAEIDIMFGDSQYKEPTTKNDSSELEKNSKKLEKGTTKNDLGVNREQLKTMIRGLAKWYVKRDNTEVGEPNTAVGLLYDDVMFGIDRLPSVTPQLSVPEVTALAEWTTKLTKECEEAYNKGYEDGVKSVNICPHCGEYIGEEE